ncbi:MAG: Fe-S cluster assembly protein SufB [Candidatus Diapherotrites archaeon]|nr:Fe-S cluster assembly protein SufB [Candidatus Diapherotrites archaeon]
MRTLGKIDPSLVEEISRKKGEPEWMRRLRLRALELFEKLPDPEWLGGLDELNIEEMVLFEEVDVRASSWDELPPEIRKFYEEMKLPEMEKRYLAGLSTSFDSEMVYTHVKKYLEEKGVILLPMEEAVKRYPDLVKRYFGRIFPPAEHKYAALHYALWSGGVFVYVPRGVKVEFPVEAFFLISEELLAQFEHTLIVLEEDAYLHFIEGCSSPQFRKFSFHDGAVEAYVHRNAHLKFTTVQNWGKNIINFNNKRAIAEEGSTVEWVEGSFGSWKSYVYPSVILREKARARISNFSIAHAGEWKESGAKLFHVGKESRSTVTAKSISTGDGVSVFRGLVRMNRGAERAFSSVSCDSLLMDPQSKAFTYPHNQIEEPSARISYEASTSFLSEEQMFYLRSRGLDEDAARALIATGFLSDVIAELPPEYGAVFRRVLEYNFRGSVG